MTRGRRSPYWSMSKRDFRGAVIHLLETEYKIVGSHRVIQMIAEDIAELAREFFPPSSSATPGTLIWTTTSSSCSKVSYGQKAEDQPTVTLPLPFLTPEDIEHQLVPHSRRKRGESEIRRMVRIIRAAYAKGGLLSSAEVAAIMNRSFYATQKKLAQFQRETGETLPLKGYVLDQGCVPTHKQIIIQLYERKVSPPDIARKTGHSLEAVDRYISDYERVKLLLRKGANSKEISQLIGRGLRTVKKYEQLALSFHPQLYTRKNEK